MSKVDIQAAIDALEFIEDRLVSLQTDCYDSEETIKAPLAVRDYMSRCIYQSVDAIASMREHCKTTLENES